MILICPCCRQSQRVLTKSEHFRIKNDRFFRRLRVALLHCPFYHGSHSLGAKSGRRESKMILPLNGSGRCYFVAHFNTYHKVPQQKVETRRSEIIGSSGSCQWRFFVVHLNAKKASQPKVEVGNSNITVFSRGFGQCYSTPMSPPSTNSLQEKWKYAKQN